MKLLRFLITLSTILSLFFGLNSGAFARELKIQNPEMDKLIAPFAIRRSPTIYI
ncbi:MAG: hypothetical protein HZB41_10975 [Ignavibacteriae bacterium]|nr:hypothetical protein [Ignavibacteriota bacterium]